MESETNSSNCAEEESSSNLKAGNNCVARRGRKRQFSGYCACANMADDALSSTFSLEIFSTSTNDVSTKSLLVSDSPTQPSTNLFTESLLSHSPVKTSSNTTLSEKFSKFLKGAKAVLNANIYSHDNNNTINSQHKHRSTASCPIMLSSDEDDDAPVDENADKDNNANNDEADSEDCIIIGYIKHKNSKSSNHDQQSKLKGITKPAENTLLPVKKSVPEKYFMDGFISAQKECLNRTSDQNNSSLIVLQGQQQQQSSFLGSQPFLSTSTVNQIVIGRIPESFISNTTIYIGTAVAHLVDYGFSALKHSTPTTNDMNIGTILTTAADNPVNTSTTYNVPTTANTVFITNTISSSYDGDKDEDNDNNINYNFDDNNSINNNRSRTTTTKVYFNDVTAITATLVNTSAYMYPAINTNTTITTTTAADTAADTAAVRFSYSDSRQGKLNESLKMELEACRNMIYQQTIKKSKIWNIPSDYSSFCSTESNNDIINNGDDDTNNVNVSSNVDSILYRNIAENSNNNSSNFDNDNSSRIGVISVENVNDTVTSNKNNVIINNNDGNKNNVIINNNDGNNNNNDVINQNKNDIISNNTGHMSLMNKHSNDLTNLEFLSQLADARRHRLNRLNYSPCRHFLVEQTDFNLSNSPIKRSNISIKNSNTDEDSRDEESVIGTVCSGNLMVMTKILEALPNRADWDIHYTDEYGNSLLTRYVTRYVTGVVNVDRLPVLLSSLIDGTTKLLKVPKFREKWTEMNHTPEARSTLLIIVSDAIKAFIKCQLEVRHSRGDYLEFLLLAAQIVGLQYISPELATLALFHLACLTKKRLILSALPQSFDNLRASKTFFETSNIDASFLDVPVENWSDTPSFQVAAVFVKDLVCINDSAKREVALAQHFNETITKDSKQKQFLLQVVEQHRKNFAEYNRELLAKI
ncbi:hypothetical protein HELRODRAFT_195101 [Helobdella robusta]|uniref:Uncharacterized protein n=1 Tax=Helobdella robusta TaxID=6412 RepID=T1FWR1_HELRO|nr:hypothetical protein HELRODRAFT_195101 [Helobdella robusta]ESO05461.1 hypothetical protein HELRODRAFT_195101 [Helobdella robusta]